MRLPPLLLACAVALGVRAAAAEAPARTSSLGWVRLPGAEACIGSRELAVAVEARLGRAVFVSPAQAEVQIEGRIEPAAGGAPGFRAHVALSDARGAVLGTRQLDAPEGGCRSLDDELALVIALLIDPDAALSPKGATPPPAPRVVVERVLVPVPAAPQAPPQAPARPWRETLAVGPAVAAGLLPRAGIGLSLRGEIEPPSFVPIELGGVVWLDARAEAPSGAARGATISLAYGMVGVCPLVWGPGATRVRGCAEVQVGAVRAVGYGFTATSGAGQEQPVAQAVLAGRVTRRIVGPLDLGLGLGVLLPFNRARFFYVDAAGSQQELFRMAPVAGLVDAAVGVAFP